MNKETATQSLAKHLGTALPLPYVVNQVLEWHLEEREDAKEELVKELLANLYRNDHQSPEYAVRKALKAFDVIKKGV